MEVSGGRRAVQATGWTGVLWLLAVMCTAPGCVSSKTVGLQGVLGFGVAGSDIRAPEALEASLALGEDVEIVAYTPIRLEADGSHFTTHEGQRRLAADNARPIDVARAVSSNPEVLEVVGVEGPNARVRGLTAGVSHLAIHTWQGADLVQVRVEPLGYVELDHPWWSARLEGSPSQTVLLAGGSITFDARRKSTSGAKLIGYGLPSSVRVEPAAAARIVNDPRELRHLHLKLGEPGRLTLEPASGTTMTFDVIAPEAVESVTLRAFSRDSASPNAEAGLAALLMAVARTADGRQVLGLGDVLEVESLTPDVCEFSLEASSELGDLQWPQWNGFDSPFVVLTPMAGACSLVARIGGRSFESEFMVAPRARGQ